MEKREKKRGVRRERAREWETAERVGGGPEAPGGNAEVSNRPGETRERGLEPPAPEPAAPVEPEAEAGGG